MTGLLNPNTANARERFRRLRNRFGVAAGIVLAMLAYETPFPPSYDNFSFMVYPYLAARNVAIASLAVSSFLFWPPKRRPSDGAEHAGPASGIKPSRVVVGP